MGRYTETRSKARLTSLDESGFPDQLPTTLVEAQNYAVQVIDLENTIVDKMNQLTNEQYESILRPVFKDDEPLMIG